MIRIRKAAATLGVAAAVTLTAAPALAVQAECSEEAQGSAAGEPCEEQPEVLDDKLEKPDNPAPDVASEELAATGVGSLGMLAAAGGALALGGGAVAAGRRRR